jgi:thioredoxin 1
MESSRPYDYLTDSSFESAIAVSRGIVILVVVAGWSGSCHMMEPIFDKLREQFQQHVTLYKMDNDTNPNTITEHSIQELPTILFFKEGQLVDQIVGTISKNELISRIQSFL